MTGSALQHILKGFLTRNTHDNWIFLIIPQSYPQKLGGHLRIIENNYQQSPFFQRQSREKLNNYSKSLIQAPADLHQGLLMAQLNPASGFFS
jgi:hypothetical protein